MIGNGVAALASTTALAPAGKDARASRQGANGFAETLDQALKGERQTADSGKAAGETATPAMHGGTSQRNNVFAGTPWDAERPATDLPRDVTKQTADTKAKGDAEVEAAKVPDLVEGDQSAPAADRRDAREIRSVGPTADDGEALASTTASKAETTRSDSIAATENSSASAAVSATVAVRKGDAGDTSQRARTEQSAPTTRSAGSGAQAIDPQAVASTSEERAPRGQAPALVDQASAGPATGRASNISSAAETGQNDAWPTVADASNGRVTPPQPFARANGKAVGEPEAKLGQSGERRQAAEMSAKTGNVDTDRPVRSSDKVVVKDARPETSAIPTAPRRAAQAAGSATVAPETSRPGPSKVADTAAKAATPPAPETATPSEQVSRQVSRARTDGNGVAQPSAAGKPFMTMSGIQSVPTAATGSDTAPANQIAAAVSRDLEELGPSRISLSTAGSPNRPLKSIQLQLNPAELGPVNIRLQSVDGELRISIRAENDQTAQMLSRDSDAIRSALRAAGISGPEITVSVNRNDSGTQPQTTGQNRDAFGQQGGGNENRENMPNESRHSNREDSSRNSAGRSYSRDDLDPGDGNRNDRVFI